MCRSDYHEKHMCFDIRKQRTLGILDTEFNQNHKRIVRDGMNNAMSLNKVSKELFAFKNNAATEQIVSKRAVLDHSQFIQQIFYWQALTLKHAMIESYTQQHCSHS